MNKPFSSLAVLVLGCAPLHGAIVVNTDLGVIDNLVVPVAGNVRAAVEDDGSGNNVSFYPPAVRAYDGPEQVFQFEITTTQTVTLTRNFVITDPDAFFLDSLETGAIEDGQELTASGNIVLFAFLDGFNGESVSAALDAGTYYLSVEGFGGGAATFDFSLGAVDFVEPEPVVGDSPENALSWGVVGVAGDLIDINTFNSAGDTELGIFDAAGNLLGNNDDTIGLLSQIVFDASEEGTYYIATGNYNTTFGSGFIAGGGPTGEAVTLTVNGVDVDGIVEGTGAFWTSFNIVPEPSSLSLVAFAGLALLRRRRS
ncbi:MAG: PEP-CTERM sorting domain-containing protein [Roseibacillus sp.]|nr:PEP-CTERM sorting domain-containing protein [Roseibacillus sp.]